MQKLTLTKITRNERVSKKTNKPFISVGIQTQEYPNKWINGFGCKENETWKSGDVVEVEKVFNSDQVDTNGNPYLNFEMPKAPSQMEMYGMLKRLNARLLEVEKQLKEPVQSPVNTKPVQTPPKPVYTPQNQNPLGNTVKQVVNAFDGEEVPPIEDEPDLPF